MFFLFGMMLVAGAVWVTMYNAGSLITGMAALFRRSKTLAPVLKTAFAYPLAYPFRTGLTTAMFALVVFSLVMMSVVSSSFTKDAAGINQWAGGYMVQATANPNNAPNARTSRRRSRADPALRGTVAGVGMVAMRRPRGSSRDCRSEGITVLWPSMAATPTSWRTRSTSLKVRAEGYADDRAVWEALAQDPSLAVVTAHTVPTSEAFGAGAPLHDRGRDARRHRRCSR